MLLNQSPAVPVPLSAEVIENGIPTERGVRVRGGLQKSAILPGPVVSLFSFSDPVSPAFFAATATAIYTVTALNPVVLAPIAVSGLTSGYFSTQQIGTVGGDFLYAVNGTDSARLYNGATWQAITGVSIPAITGVPTSQLSQVWLYRNRLFFVRKDTLSAYYLPVDSISGAAGEVSLAGVFQKGGSLLLGATWSQDSGSGMDDRVVFLSTEGEVAIYQGGNPASAADWGLVGRYDMARPLGVRCVMQAGGDLLIATTEGIVPLSQVMAKDPAALSLAAVTKAIQPLWAFEARRAVRPVELLKWQDRGIGIVTLPESDRALVVNLQTGAWAVQTGWSATSAALFVNKAYMARGSVVYAMDETGLDDTSNFTMRICWAFQDFGDPVALKVAQMMRLAFFSNGAFAYSLGMATDYAVAFGAAPAAALTVPPGGYMIWDVTKWDEALWWSPSLESAAGSVTGDWRSVRGAGMALAPVLQITSGSASKLNIEVIRADLAYEAGGSVV